MSDCSCGKGEGRGETWRGGKWPLERGSEEGGKRNKEDEGRGMSGKKEKENQRTGGRGEKGGKGLWGDPPTLLPPWPHPMPPSLDSGTASTTVTSPLF